MPGLELRCAPDTWVTPSVMRAILESRAGHRELSEEVPVERAPPQVNFAKVFHSDPLAPHSPLLPSGKDDPLGAAAPWRHQLDLPWTKVSVVEGIPCGICARLRRVLTVRRTPVAIARYAIDLCSPDADLEAACT